MVPRNPDPVRDRVASDPFGSTRWSVVLAAGQSGSDASSALETLCHIYWPPVYAYVRRRAKASHDALDLTQGFFSELLERGTVALADPSRGRFRSFLLTAVKNFLANDHARASALKRGGGRLFFSLDYAGAERDWRSLPSDQRSPEQEFERRWAITLLRRVLERLSAEQSAAGRATQFEALRLFITAQNGETTQAEVAERLEISEEAVRSAMYRLRKRYGVLLRDEVAQTVDSVADIDEELQGLINAVSS